MGLRQCDKCSEMVDEAKAFCEQHKLFFIETSALSDSNVTRAFETILKGMVNRTDERLRMRELDLTHPE